MRKLIVLLIGFPAAICLAQTPDTNLRLLEEMKGIRAAIERLVQVMDAMDKRQEATVALLHMTTYETQLRILQSDQRTLAAQEVELSRRVTSLEELDRRQEGGIDPFGAKSTGGVQNPRQRAETQEELAGIRRTRDEIRARLQSANRAVAELRGRMERLQQTLDAAKR